MPAEDIVVVGRIGGPYGVQGWVHLQSFTAPEKNILDYRPWMLKVSDGPWHLVQDIRCRPHKKGFVMLLDEVADRNAAAALNGALIGVPATELPVLDGEDEFYWRDLTGCRVVNLQSVELGIVDDLLETGANDVLVVKQAGAGGQPGVRRGNLLIPFNIAYVVEVDLNTRILRVDWDSQW